MATSARRNEKASTGRFNAMAALAFGVLKLSPEARADLVSRLVPGKTSIRSLTNAEADLVIDELKRRAGQTPTRPQPRRRSRGITLLITPAERERLAELTRNLIAAGLAPNYLEGVRFRACGLPYPNTSQQAVKAIEALKALEERVAAGWRPENPA
jgi:hypothetical protein